MHAADALQPATDARPLLLITLADRLTRTVAVARALIQSGRAVDLAGIEDGIGMLCAKTLDLPESEARRVVPELRALRDQVDSLAASLRPPGDG